MRNPLAYDNFNELASEYLWIRVARTQKIGNSIHSSGLKTKQCVVRHPPWHYSYFESAFRSGPGTDSFWLYNYISIGTQPGAITSLVSALSLSTSSRLSAQKNGKIFLFQLFWREKQLWRVKWTFGRHSFLAWYSMWLSFLTMCSILSNTQEKKVFWRLFYILGFRFEARSEVRCWNSLI